MRIQFLQKWKCSRSVTCTVQPLLSTHSNKKVAEYSECSTTNSTELTHKNCWTYQKAYQASWEVHFFQMIIQSTFKRPRMNLFNLPTPSKCTHLFITTDGTMKILSMQKQLNMILNRCCSLVCDRLY